MHLNVYILSFRNTDCAVIKSTRLYARANTFSIHLVEFPSQIVNFMQTNSIELVERLISLTNKLKSCQIDYSIKADNADEQKKGHKYERATVLTVSAEEVDDHLQDLNLCHQLACLRAHLLQWIPKYWMNEWKDQVRQFVNNLNLLSGKNYSELLIRGAPAVQSTTQFVSDSKVVVAKPATKKRHQYDSESDDEDEKTSVDYLKLITKTSKYLLLAKPKSQVRGQEKRPEFVLEFLESSKFKELKAFVKGKFHTYTYWHRHDFYKFRKVVDLEVLPLNLWWLLFRQLILFFNPEHGHQPHRGTYPNFSPGALKEDYGYTNIPAEENTWVAYVHPQHYHPELYPETHPKYLGIRSKASSTKPEEKLNTELRRQLSINDFGETKATRAGKVCSQWFTMKDWIQCSAESSFGLWDEHRKLRLKELLIREQTWQIIEFFFPRNSNGIACATITNQQLVASQVAARLEFRALHLISSDGAYNYDKVAGYNFWFWNCLPNKTDPKVMLPDQHKLYWSENETCSGNNKTGEYCENCHRFSSNHSVVVNLPARKLDMDLEQFTIVYKDEVPELKIEHQDVEDAEWHNRYSPSDHFSSPKQFVNFVEWILCCQEENDSYYRSYLRDDFPTMNDNLQDLENLNTFRTFSTVECIRKHRELTNTFELAVRDSGRLPTALASLSGGYLEPKLLNKYHQ